jgi:hypothetical protein
MMPFAPLIHVLKYPWRFNDGLALASRVGAATVACPFRQLSLALAAIGLPAFAAATCLMPIDQRTGYPQGVDGAACIRPCCRPAQAASHRG